ncbi:MAG: hypothetical protein AAFX56_15960 [Pseudomonadota bacterium]
MKHTTLALFAVAALLLSANANADKNLGIGVKAGTLGIGVEGTWRALPWIDLRLGMNRYDYDDDGTQAGIPYDATLALDSFYATANLRFPLSPFRLTGGIYSNSNELQLTSVADGTFEIGGINFNAADVGTLSSVTSFPSTSPYVGIGYDFTLMGRVGLNLDLGVLWQGDPEVTLVADGVLATDPTFISALESERQELDDEVSDYKAWPVLSIGFVVNFM